MTYVRYRAADCRMTGLPDKSVDAVVGSPPYLERRDYGLGGEALMKIAPWIEFMLATTQEAMRVSKGPVLWVANGCVVKGRYQPALEGLMWEAFKRGWRVEHPLIWSKNATPNRKDWWCNGWEYVVAFIPEGAQWTFRWEQVAKPHAYAEGGAFRTRGVDGKRKQQDEGRLGKRKPLARPYDIIRATVGGGHMGHPDAHKHEAPYPESLIKQILPALVPPGGIVLDPFGGSGTTAAVAVQCGCNAITSDIRPEQRNLAQGRLRDEFHATFQPYKTWCDYFNEGE